MTRFAVTAGFSSQKILQPVVGYGIDGRDSVQILAPAEEEPPDPRQQAIEDTREMLSAVATNIQTDVVEIDCTSFTAAIFESRAVLAPTGSNAQPVVCLAGGASDLNLPLVLATMTLWPEQIKALRYYSELQSTGRDCTFPNLLTSLPGRTVETYDTIVAETGYEANVSEYESKAVETVPILGGRTDRSPSSDLRTTNIRSVANATDKSAATIGRHTDALAERDFVMIFEGDERNKLSPTVTGLLHR